MTFPAPTIPYPLSSDLSDDSEAPYPIQKPSFGNKVCPPAPSPMVSPAVVDDGALEYQQQSARRAAEGLRRQQNPEARLSHDLEGFSFSEAEDEAGPGLEIDSESEDLEMGYYANVGEEVTWRNGDEEERVKTRNRRRLSLHGEVGPSLGDRLIMADGDRPVVSKEEKRIADVKVIRSLAINVILIGLWYLFSLLISIYNKWMFDPKHLDFKFPLFTTCTHMVVQFSLASLVLFAFPKLRPVGFFGRVASPDPQSEDPGMDHFMGAGNSVEERKKQQAGIMTKWFYATRVGPCGAATGLDIGLGNMSMKFISLAFYTMCKSSALAFVMIFAFIFRLEKITWKLVGVITVMTIGVVMMVAGETTFVPIGFFLVIMSSALSGLRWSLTQILLLRNPATSNPFSSIFFLAPIMFISILAIAIPVEGFVPLSERLAELAAQKGAVNTTAILLFPGAIAFLMVSSEFALLQRTSVVTLSICGIFKEVVTISAATIVFGDPLTPINISGLCVTILSIAAYNYIKIKRMRREAREGTVGAAAYVPVGGDDEEDEDEGLEERAKSTSMDGGVLGNTEIQVGESALSPRFPGPSTSHLGGSGQDRLL
ncbi:TPT-domain-containing protein [Tuber magnatum]|uniref:TPT-domain-containing protein n=1 Tax=Tuber magnatum TaxID=42249 RepID=A0A317SL51_9PEZI|nr:TPT-domain-containing protein [Tuber magnatum]